MKHIFGDHFMKTLTVQPNSFVKNQNVRELSLSELSQVSGGRGPTGVYGTGAGGLFSSASFGAASRFAGGFGLLYGSFQVGYAVGTAIYSGYTYYRFGGR
jgi:lactobin A/cerein 7B family class IIb bacteriocin